MKFRDYIKTEGNKANDKCIISLDCEFEEVITKKGLVKIVPISIGMEVRLPTGEFKTYYGIFETKKIKSSFVKEKVIPLLNDGNYNVTLPKPASEIKSELIQFLSSLNVKKKNIDIYTYFGTYDMLMLIQTLGGFKEAFNYIIPISKELPVDPKKETELINFINSENYPKNGNRIVEANHNALTDARYQMNQYLYAKHLGLIP